MADPQTDEPQNTQQPTTYDDAVKSFAPGRARVYVHPSTADKEPANTDKPVSFDDVFSQFSDAKAKKDEDDKNKADPDIFKKSLISNENKRLGGTQFTSQQPKKDDYVGPAVQGKDLYGERGTDDDDTTYIKDEKGNYSAADKNKHLVFRDPDSGEYGVYNRDPDKNYSPISGRLVGLGNLVQEGLQTAPTRLPSTVGAATRGQQALGAAGRVEDSTGVRVPVPQSAVTENAVTPAITKGLEALPGGSAPFDAAAGRMEGGLSQAQNTATAGSTSAEQAGNTAREAINAEAKPKTGLLAQRVSDAYDKVDAHVDPLATRDLSETRKVADEIQTRFDATKGSSGSAKVDNPSIKAVLEAATDPKGVTYQGLKDLRSRVGEMLEQGSSIAETGVSDKELRGLYKGLTADLEGHIKTAGGARGLQMWKRANVMARVASERRETLGKILGANRSDEGIFGAIERMAGSTNSADASTLALAKKSIPADEWNEVASTVASRLGRVKTDTGTHFDPGKFVKDYDKISERGKSLLFGDQQRLRKALDSISDLSKFTEPVSHPGPLAHLATAAIALEHGGGEGGLFSKVAKITGAVMGMKVIGSMLSKPATAESVAKWMQGYKLATLKPTKGNVMLFDRLSEGLANDAAKEDRENIGAGASKAADLAKKLIVLISPMGNHNGQ